MHYAYTHASIQEPTRTEVILPAFDYDVVWAGVSDLLATWEINNTTEFSLKLPIDAPNDTFVLCVAWDDEDSNTFRYKLWEGGVLHYPVYDGERLGVSARLEVWSLELDHATLDEEYTLYSSWLTEPEVCICTGGAATPVTIETTESIDPGVTPPDTTAAVLAIQGYVQLRTLTGYVNNELRYLEFGNVLGDALGGNFVFNSSDSTADDDVDYIKPNDISVGTPGRWIRQNNPN